MSKPLPKSKRPYWMGERPTHSWSKAKHYAFLNSKGWRKAAAAHKAAHPLCVVCLEKGLVEPATQTDHIVPVAEGGALLEWSNMQSLCHACHMAKSNAERAARVKGRGGRST